jgi:hypothetical protein
MNTGPSALKEVSNNRLKTAYLWHVGMDGSVLGSGDGQCESGLDGRLVPTRETATSICGLKLGDSGISVLTILIKI